LTGSTGLTGATGAAGTAATVSVGTTTTGAAGSNASVTNSGTSSAAVLNFTVPRGATGLTGNTGPAGVNSFGSYTSRALSLATAYQCTNTAIPCVVTITLQSQSSISLSGTSNNEGAITVGNTSGVATGTGTNVATYKNNLGGVLVVGLSITSQQANTYTVMVPAGWYFAVRQTAGTGLQIVSAFDQAVGS
jgi:hypothetical protein